MRRISAVVMRTRRKTPGIREIVFMGCKKQDQNLLSLGHDSVFVISGTLVRVNFATLLTIFETAQGLRTFRELLMQLLLKTLCLMCAM
jgi:hypothetical protein